MEDEPLLPKIDYYLDESDPDILLLRRQDGAFVAAFSTRGATREGIVEAAREDYAALLGATRTCWTRRPRGARAPGSERGLLESDDANYFTWVEIQISGNSASVMRYGLALSPSAAEHLTVPVGRRTGARSPGPSSCAYSRVLRSGILRSSWAANSPRAVT